MNVVIMAGGGGTRLWPLSRKNLPKQFLDFGTDKTLLERTYDRAKSVAEEKDIFIATLEDYQEKVQNLLPSVPKNNLLIEPMRRDTTAAFAAAAVQLQLLNRADEPTIFLWSDHLFTAEEEFIKDIRKIPRLIKENPKTIITMGHIPTNPETGFGYIETDHVIEGEEDIYIAKGFREKPNKATAEKFVEAGNYYWNIGTFSLYPTYLLEELRKNEPDIMKQIDKYAQALKNKDTKTAEKVYEDIPKISIDYTVIERTPRLIVITGDYGWTDIGSWSAVREIFGVNGDHMPTGHHVHIDSQNNYIYNTAEKVVSLIGLKDTIIVVTDDAVLVTNTDSAGKVKEVVQKLEEEEEGKGYL